MKASHGEFKPSFLKLAWKSPKKLKEFSKRIQVRFLNLGQRPIKDQKSSLKKFKSGFSTIVPFI